MAFFLNKLKHLETQTHTERRLGTNYVLTCDPALIQQIHSSDEFTRSAISRRMVEHDGAVGAMVSQDLARARVKRPELKKFLKTATYERVLKVTQDTLDRYLLENINKDQTDVYFCLRTGLHFGFMEELLGINYTQSLREEVKQVGLDKSVKEETFLKMFLLNNIYLPLWFKNIFTPSLREKNKKFQQMVEIIYNKAQPKPNSWFARLKELEANGTLSKSEVLGEIRAIYISSNTLAISIVWALYRIASGHINHTKELLKPGNYARYAFMETLRLHPPFQTVSYDKKSKCPFHRNDVYVVSVINAHTNPRYWDNPDIFWPLRFKEGMSKIKKGTYIPFGGNERACPGTAMSMAIAPKLIQCIFKKYRFVDVQRPVIKYSGDQPLDNNKFFAKIVLAE